MSDTRSKLDVGGLLFEHKKAIVIVAVILFLLLFANPCTVVKAGHRGVILTMGAVSNKIMDEGLNFRIPFVQTIILIDVQIQKANVTAPAASKDLQEVKSDIAVNFHVARDAVNKVYQEIGLDFEDRIIGPSVHEVVKAVTAKYTAVDLVTNREGVKNEIETSLRERLTRFNIIVDAVAIENFQFSEQFTRAIEDKQTAEQKALKAQRDLERIKVEAEQQITTARAQAEAYRLQTQSFSPLMRDMEWIKKWDGHLPHVQAGSSGLMVQIQPGN